MNNLNLKTPNTMKELLKKQLLCELDQMAEDSLAIDTENLSDEHYCLGLLNGLLLKGHAKEVKLVLESMANIDNKFSSDKEVLDEINELVNAEFSEDGKPLSIKDNAILQVEKIGFVLPDRYN